jgi:tRNA threonylcarbamoyladenosine biosynthesis protein TsaB
MSGDHSLVLDAATQGGSVAVLHGLEVVATREVRMRADDEERLMPAVVACCDEAGVTAPELARVVCGEGPGSFTSLRIAASIAKGIATAAGCPVFAVSSLLLSAAAAAPALPGGRYLSVLDAHRDELFVLPVEIDSGEVRAGGALAVVAAEAIPALAAAEKRRVIGPGQEIESVPLASAVSALLPHVIASGPVDVVSWEPVYGRAPEAQVRWERAHGRALTP